MPHRDADAFAGILRDVVELKKDGQWATQAVAAQVEHVRYHAAIGEPLRLQREHAALAPRLRQRPCREAKKRQVMRLLTTPAAWCQCPSQQACRRLKRGLSLINHT